LKTLYFSLFHCHITYANEIWSAAAKNLINDLYLKQKAAIRIISDSKYNSHTAPLFKKLEILPLFDLIQLNLVKIMYYHKNNLLPNRLCNTWRTNQERNMDTGGPILRHTDNFVIPFARTDQVLRFPLVTVPLAWNNLSPVCKNMPNVLLFCNHFKTMIFSTLPDVPVCTRLFCPVCQALPAVA
jgi:hypothetical protein